MKTKGWVLVILCLVLALGAASGCSKKRASSMPPGATGSDAAVRDHDWASGKGSGYGEDGLTEEQRLARQREKAMSELGQRIQFGFDSYELNQEARGILQQKADVMKSTSGVRLVIEGHCDDRGTEEYNLALGERRARAAYEFLVLLGVSPERLSIVSFGEERPLVKGENETAWAQNRRDEFRAAY
ncbi:MAG: peptidoglycan-associated lipoprotein Pal [Desulfovibrio aminophilus]|jgi:peptidoglycan-associated lipoprotein|uniref:peptidoglycan-associated lipoprotein Pal n=1 Tax=Desulfovibrio aminophilus TaxID=81425 RepID=UPI000485C284|nr:peptidoglycan-associated lipoprotein Pal [Desulfovibrio aminophilus]